VSRTTDRPPHGPPSVPLNRLSSELARLHRNAGEPSLRDIERLTGKAISHTTVSKILRGGRLPRWGPLELIVEALGGDTASFKALWIEAREEKDSVAGSASSAAEPEQSRDSSKAAKGSASTGDDDSVGAIKSLFPTLDSVIGGGFWPSQLIVIGGRPGVGKSTLGIQLACASAIHQRVPTLIVTFEAAKDDLYIRIISSESRIPHQLLRIGNLTDDQWAMVARAAGYSSAAPLYLDDSCSHILADTIARIEQLVAEHGVRIIIIDSIQQIQVREGESGGQEVVHLLRSLKRLAMKLQVTVIALSQVVDMPRYLSPRNVELPSLPDLTSFEQDADVILLIYRDDQTDALSPRTGEADFILAKNRYGPRDIVTVAALLHIGRFLEFGPADAGE
jgi:replicative DNA helicase